jgi:anaerobic magnesium-protoporphyrin IX monomethyl ester cyclase
MRIHMVALEDGITATGFRKIAAYVERLEPDTKVFYVGPHSFRSLWKSISRRGGMVPAYGPEEIDQIAHGLAGADIVAFSSMTGYAELTKRVISRVRVISPRSYLMWGGVHPIIHPEDAVRGDVNAICTGEGELAFEEFFLHFRQGADHTATPNFWFKNNGEIRRNRFRPLMTPGEMETLPFPKYGGEEWLFRRGKGFTRVTLADYLNNNGLAYPAIWSIGCPFHCTYCGNTVFIANDPNYRRIRHTSPSYIIAEVRRALEVHPHLSTVLFHDDSFMAIPVRELKEFAAQWREQVNLPFVAYGVIPTYVKREKLEILTWAGMHRVRMGIQSGSERILRFYRRPTTVARIERAVASIAEFSRYHINPAYDVIVDNPVETRQDVVDTLELLYRMPRPFTVNIFSLRVIPNTVLERQLEDEGLDIEQINANYLAVRPSWANVLLYILLLLRPPRRLFERWLERVRAYGEERRRHPLLIHLVRIPWLVKQGLRHVRMGEFSVITGRTGWILWRTGLLRLWLKLSRRRLELPEEGSLLAARPAHPSAPPGATEAREDSGPLTPPARSNGMRGR